MGRKSKNKKRKNIPVVKPTTEVSPIEVTELKSSEKISETMAVDAKSDKPKVVENIKSKKKKVKKEKKENKLVRKLKETGSELKKVTWPKFPKVVKQTGVVLAVVVFFGLG